MGKSIGNGEDEVIIPVPESRKEMPDGYENFISDVISDIKNPLSTT